MSLVLTTALLLAAPFVAVVAIGSTLALISDTLERWWKQ